ncbi:DUF6286 domain-containing protein [Streptacidiphilus sp. PAMC 29251]
MSTVMTSAGPTGAGSEADEAPAAAGTRPSRFWSSRRNAAALAALVAVAAAGALLYEEIYVHTGHSAHAWRTWITDQLSQRQLNNAWAITGSALLCVLGLWLLLLAATPGLRRLLPLAATGSTGLRAGLDRRAAAAMLRRAALEAPGVEEARAKVGRRKAKVLATVGFGDHEEVRAALTEHLAAERGRLGLVRPPLVSVKIKGRS